MRGGREELENKGHSLEGKEWWFELVQWWQQCRNARCGRFGEGMITGANNWILYLLTLHFLHEFYWTFHIHIPHFN